MNPRNVWPAVVVALGGTIAIAVMAILKVDRDLIVTVASVLVVPVLAALLAAQNASTQATVQAVQQQTNGNTSALVNLVAEQGRMLAQMHPPAIGLPTTPPPAAPEPPPAEPSP